METRKCHCGRITAINEWCACVSALELVAHASHAENLRDGFKVNGPAHDCLTPAERKEP
jgi:hypothetical protein